MEKFSRLNFKCPRCGQALEKQSKGVFCPSCLIRFRFEANRSISFIESDLVQVSDSIDRIKSFIKKLGPIYNFIVDVVSPVYPSPTFEQRRIVKKALAKGELVLNLGSGASSIGKEVVNVDFFPYANVDIVCSIDALPFQDDCVDLIVNIAVLEHVPNPSEVVEEFFRVLKPGGKIYCFVPFIQGFHASPWDFQRYTKPGLKVLFSKFEIESITSAGPTSGMLWIVQEWVAMILSLGLKPVHKIVWPITLLLLWPLKFLDVFLRHSTLGENISSGFSVTATKPIRDDSKD
jgi:SAM-dependent methyltransferase